MSALISSYEDLIIESKISFAAEVGLSGEIRAVNRIEQRISEADKLGFDKIFISKYNMKGISQTKFQIKIVGIAKVKELVENVFQ